jgi:hypothetical protein
LSLPPEFFGSKPLQPATLKRRYGLSDIQFQALKAMHPFRTELTGLADAPFATKEAAAAATYALVERMFARTPPLRESVELGGQLYRQHDGRWRVSLPNIGADGSSIGTGSKPNTAAPVTDDSFFWHTHPSALTGRGHAPGFSFTDLTTTLLVGRGMFVYQNGRAYRMEIGNAWRQMSHQGRNDMIRALMQLGSVIRSTDSSADQKRKAISMLRDMLRSDVVAVTVFERSGVNISAGQPIEIMPVFFATSEGAVQIVPNRAPPKPLAHPQL